MRRGERNLKKRLLGLRKDGGEWGWKTGIRISSDCPVIALLTQSGNVFKTYGKSVWRKGFDRNLKLRKERS